VPFYRAVGRSGRVTAAPRKGRGGDLIGAHRRGLVAVLSAGPPVWDKCRNRAINGRCRMHGGLSSGPKTEEGRRRIAESNRTRAANPNERGKHEAVTQRGIDH
jgi:hypothetical protein